MSCSQDFLPRISVDCNDWLAYVGHRHTLIGLMLTRGDLSQSRSLAAEQLHWLRQMGAADLVRAHPVSWFEAGEPARPALAASPQPATRAPTTPRLMAAPSVPLLDAAAEASAIAGSAMSLEALKDVIERFDGCALKKTASRMVFADGDPNAPVMLVGEAPGADEDRQGLPFVGAAGQLLDRMLAAIGLNRRSSDSKTAVYITNIVNWRPPGNRRPSAQETQICLPLVRRHIALAKPKLLILLGNTSVGALLDTQVGITRLRGNWTHLSIDGVDIPALPTFHPSYLLRAPAEKGLAWADWLSLKARLDG
jgi:uracil-DNA glycosylase